MRQTLRDIWNRTIVHAASLNLARPAPIPVTVATSDVRSYLVAAVRCCAPGSTLAVVLATVLAAACHIGQSQVLGWMTALALQGAGAGTVRMLIFLFALWMATPLLNVLKNLAMLYSSQNLRIGVIDHLTSRLMHAQALALAASSVGKLVERVELASNSLPSVVGSLVDTAVKLAAVAVLSIWILWDIAGALAICAGVWMAAALLWSSYLACTGMSIVEDASEAHAKVIAELTEMVMNVPLIRAFVAQRFERDRFSRPLAADLHACRRVRSYWVFVLLLETLGKWLFGAGVAIYAAYAYGAGTLGLSGLVTICSLVISLSWHFESVAFHFVELFEATGVLRSSLREIATVPTEDMEAVIQIGGEIGLPRPGAVAFQNVGAGYGDGAAVLQDGFVLGRTRYQCGDRGGVGFGQIDLVGAAAW